MRRTLIFLGSDSPFMMKTIIRNLEKADYEVLSMKPTAEAVKKYADRTNLYVLFLGPSIMEYRDVILELCGEKGKLIFLLGTAEELRTWKRLVPPGSVAGSFERPLDIKRFVLIVDELCGKSDALRGKKILLVDDDGDYLKLVSKWLGAKYQVAVVNSGMQAVTYLANNTPDLILLDYSMPVASGPQVLEMIRSEPKTAKIPVMFLTGKDDKDSVMEVMSLKPEGYILKSIDREGLMARVEEFFHPGD